MLPLSVSASMAEAIRFMLLISLVMSRCGLLDDSLQQEDLA